MNGLLKATKLPVPIESTKMPDPHFPKLNDSNYADWRYMMVAMLVEKDLWDVVDGSLT